jgi:hypothetical protein
MSDHAHLLVECDPQYEIHRLVKQIKGTVIPATAAGVSEPKVEDANPCGRTATSLPLPAAQPWRS